MAMSDCRKCWDTPCTCGEGYRGWSKHRIEMQIATLRRVLKEKEELAAATEKGRCLCGQETKHQLGRLRPRPDNLVDRGNGNHVCPDCGGLFLPE